MIDYLSRKEILHDAFFKKYAAKKYMKASIIVREWIRSEYAEEEITSAMMETKEEVEEAGQENMPEEEDENVSDEDDYMYANELEEHEVE
jgi:G2/mitotic-specific cyclin 2